MRMLGFAAGLGMAMTTALPSFAQTPGEIYTIRPGDTLRAIATRAYGSSDSYNLVYSANRSVIGSNPNLIGVGMQLTIPLADGTTVATVATTTAAPVAVETVAPATVIEEAATAPATTTVAAAAPEPAPADLGGQAIPFQRDIRILTGSGFAPFTDQELPGGGMLTQVVSAAMERGDPNRGYEVFFVNDWGSHLTMLLPVGAFDLAFPWAKPDCRVIDRLGPESVMRCTQYDWSNPLYENVNGYYAAPGSPYADARTPEDLFGATLCRPTGWLVFDLEGRNLVEPNITYVTPNTPEDCLRGLADGTVDVVAIDVQVVEDAVRNYGFDVVFIERLADILTLHVIAHKSNPFGRTYLTLINRGLRDMGESGEWFQIVSTFLAENT